MKISLSYLCFVIAISVKAQCPTSAFSVSGSVCQEESIELINTSSNASSYEWDFCIGGFEEEPTELINNSISVVDGWGFDLEEDGGDWYGFGIDRSAKKLLRLSYGSSPQSSPEITDLGGFGGVFKDPEDIKLYKSGDNWYGFVGSLDAGFGIVRLDFGTSLSNTPVATNIGDFGFGVRFRGLEVIEQAGDLILILVNYNSNSLIRINYRDSFDNSIAAEDIYNSGSISGANLPTDIEFVGNCGDSLAYLTSLNNGSIIRLNFHGDVLSTPTVENTYTFTGISRPFYLNMVQEGSSFYGVVVNESDNIRVIDFGDLDNGTVPVELSKTTNPRFQAISAYRYEGVNYVQGITNTDSYKLVSYESDCGASQGFSVEQTPAGVSYNTSGNKSIWLKATDSDGGINTSIGSTSVSTDAAPTIALSTGGNVCITNNKTFTATDTSSPEDAVTVYSWDFDGDDVVDLTQNSGDAGFGTASIDYTTYGGVGAYTVKLTGENAGGCSNTTELSITLYAAPATPTDLTATAVSLCTNNEITFSYAPLASLPSEASLIWDINGEETSTEDAPVYTFTTSGDKEISLQVVLPSCTTAVYTKTISIGEGPEVGFSYTNNCFGEAIEFTDESGSGTSYSWDFGDGSPVETNATSFNPTHTYAAAGTYSVSLTVENAAGCETTVSQEIEVSDASLVDFTTGVAEANVPTSFTGIDATLSDNAVLSWSWDFAGLGSSTDQNPSFTFTEVRDYDVTLSVTTSQGCSDEITKTVTVNEAEFPTASFTADVGDGCLETSIALTNTSVNANSYEWDFCLGDFEVADPTQASISIAGLSSGYGYVSREDEGIWYSFIVSKVTNSIIRLTHGDSPLNAPSEVEDLGGFGLLSAPEGLDVINFGGNWYGVVGGGNNGAKITRIDFTGGLGGAVTGTDLGSFGFNGRIRELALHSESDGLILVFSGYNTNEFYRVDYGNSFDNVIDETSDIYTSSHSDLAFITGFDIEKIGSDYIVHALSINNENLIRLNFGSSLLNAPTQEVVYTLSGLLNGYRLKLIEESGIFYGFTGGESTFIRVFNFGDLESVQTPTEVTYSSALPNVIGYEAIRYEGSSYLQGVGGSTLYTLSFEAECGESVGFSEAFEPAGINYNTSGTKEILLKAIDGDGDATVAINSVVIDDNQAPTFSLSTGDNVCITNNKTFTATDTSSPEDAVTVYYWDFDGDEDIDLTQNSGDAGFGTASIDYTTYGGVGAYTVKLTGENAGGCSNTTELSITLYAAPATPTDLTATAVSLCTNNEITFSYAPLASLPSEASLIWDINGEETSTEDAPVYTFTTSGDKEISLQVVLPSCTTAVYTKTISIGEGPEVGFSYTNNCFGEAIAFTDESGSGTSYSWDFGDGSPVETNATSFNPTHTYAAAGTYSVSLTVENAAGCETTVSQEIEVSDASLVDFTTGVAEANVPTSFTGIDATLSDNAVLSWSWNFAGLGSSTDQNPSFTFTEVRDYDVTLSVTTSQGCSDEITKTVTVNEAEFPTASFTADVGDGCLETSIALTNTSVNANSYEWDFCLGDFEVADPTQASISIAGLSSGYGYVSREDEGIWYSFIVSKVTNSIIRLTHGDSPLNAPSEVEDLGGFGLLSAPEGLDVINFGGNWYGVVGGGNNGAKITRIDFTGGLGGAVTGTDLGSFGFNGRIRELALHSESDGLILVFSGYNTNEFYRVDYGNSFDNVIDETSDIYTSSHSDLAFITGFDIEKIGSDYIVHALSINNENLIRLNFGSSLLNAPTQEVVYTLSGLLNGYRLKLIEESGIFYGFTGGESTFIRVFNFGDLESVQTPTEVTYSSALPNVIGYEAIRYEGSSYLQGVGGSTLYTLSFEAECGESVGFSEAFEPAGINYNTSGTKEILLKAIDGDGDATVSQGSVVINENIKPESDFTLDASRCVTNENTFTPSLTGLTSYNWDFGDGTTSTDESPTHQYGSTGTYTVRLDVVDGSCNNFIEQEITIYPEPPVPSFTVSPETYCFGSELVFANTTDETGLEEVISYSWNFGSGSEVFTKDATFIFQTPGTKTITLTALIPGCETVFEQEIEILPGPTSAFTANVVCLNEVTTFSNNSTDAISYQWNFGDGFESTAENPTHLYQSAGSYITTLTVTDTNGCTNTTTNEVIVETIPDVSFDFELACSSMEGVQFTDMTTVDNADVISWTWFVNDIATSTDQNPTIIFEDGGIKTVRLVAQSSNGCESYYQEDINIRSSPDPDFSFEIGCQGEITSFTDITLDVGNPITQWLWTIEGETYNTENVNHVFSSYGLFDVTLEVTSDNFCSESITKTIEVNQLPNVSFSIDGNCSNEIVTLTDNSTEFEDVILSRRWMLNEQLIGNGSEVFIEQLNAGSYDLILEVETAAGCIVSDTKELVVDPTPNSSFDVSSTYGLPNDEIIFTNTSTGSTSNQWLLNGVPFSDNSNTESIIFSEIGKHKVSLVSSNSFGCVDTTTTEILIDIPIVDLVISDFEIVDQNGNGKIFLDIQNLSNLPVEVMNVIINLEDKLATSEQIFGFIGIGDTKRFALDIGIPLTFSKPSFVCITLQSQFVGYSDVNPLNNEKCLTIDPKIQIEAPYPNPVTDQFRMKVVIPENAGAKVSLVNSVGKMEENLTYSFEKGLNNIFIDMSELSSGIYFVTVEVMGEVTTYRFFKL